MDEKLRIEIDYILAEVANHSNRYEDEDDAFRAIKQAFRDAKWLEPQQPEEGSTSLTIKDELVPNPYPEYTIGIYPSLGHKTPHLRHVGFNEGCKAQLAYDKATMVQLPSEARATEICREIERLSVYEAIPSSGVAHELLRLLGVKP